MEQLQKCHICIIEIPDGVEREEIFEIIMTENFQKLMSGTEVQIPGRTTEGKKQTNSSKE